MGKLQNKNTLTANTASLQVIPQAGWSWYCGYHDTAGSGDDEDEVKFMAGAHVHYTEVDGEVCELYFKQHIPKEES